MWTRNWIVIEVTQRHIDNALARSSTGCMIAEAIKDAIPDARHVAVDIQCIRLSRRGCRYIFLTPHIAQDAIVAFDQGRRDQLRPLTLRLRPAQIAKSGKRRRQCPSNSELRGSGLSVNPVQLHLSEAEQQPPPPTTGRYLPTGERNLSPDRRDGLARPKYERNIALPEPPEPTRRRRPQRKVSTAAPGSVPCVLGGRTPPLSILSNQRSTRREFGLRTLRQ